MIKTDSIEFDWSTQKDASWYVNNIKYQGKNIQDNSTFELPGGFEITINRMRYTNHISIVKSGKDKIIENDLYTELILEHLLDNQCKVYQHFLIYKNDTIIESFLSIRNCSCKEIILSRINFLQLNLDSSFLYHTERFEHYNNSVSASVSDNLAIGDCSTLFHNCEENYGLALLNSAPGNHSIIKPGTYTNIGYNQSTFPVEQVLPPNKEFITDKGTMIFYEGLSENAIYNYINNYLRKKALQPKLSYCSWVPFMRDINDEKILSQIDLTNELGFDTFIIDDGWQDNSGDWNIDKKKFPQGFDNIVDKLNKNNMNLGLWFCLTVVSETSDIFISHPDWFLKDKNGDYIYTQVFEGKMPMACLATPYAEYIENKISEYIRKYNLKYIKLDLPLTKDVYANPPIQCYSDKHNHKSANIADDYAINVIRILKGIAKNWKTEFPDCVIDFTFELWGNWHGIDYSLLETADCSWLSNLGDSEDSIYGPYEARSIARNRSKVYPPLSMVIGNMRLDSPYCLESAISAMSSYPMLLGDLRGISEVDKKSLKELFEFYNSIDKQGNYNFKSWSRSNTKSEWSAYAHIWKNGNKLSGYVAIFRNLSKTKTNNIILDLEFKENIKLKALYNKDNNSNSDSLAQGTSLFLENEHDFEILVLN